MEKTRSTTIKWFWLYRAFSYDLVFYYTIATLFYTTLKGFSLSQVMFLHSFAAASTFVLLLPVSWIIKKIGNTFSIRLGSFLWVVYLLATIIFKNFYLLMFFETICSVGTIFKILSDSVIITNTLEKHGQDNKYVKIESKGITTYFVADCFAALISGYLFKINPYIPMILCLAVVFFAFVLSCFIKDETESYKGLKFCGKTNTTFAQKPKFFKDKTILKFLFFVISLYGLIMSIGYLQNIGLVDLGFDSVQIGYVVVGAKIVNALSSFLYQKFQKNFKKVFPVLVSFLFLFFTLCLGLCFTFLPNATAKFSFIILFMILLEFFKQPYKIFAKDFIRRHSQGEKRQNLYTIYFLCEVSSDFLLCLIGGFLLEGLSVGWTYLALFAVALLPISVSAFLLFKNKEEVDSTQKILNIINKKF